MFVNYFVLTGREKYLKFVEDIDRSNISTIHKFAIGILRGESLYTDWEPILELQKMNIREEKPMICFWVNSWKKKNVRMQIL